MVRILY